MSAELERSIAALEAKRQRIDEAIRLLREVAGDLNTAPFPKGKRGRKSMGPEERKQVSARMKLYWENRRKSRKAWA